MNFISRLIGCHKLILLSFYSFLQRYLTSHQKDVTHILAYLIQVLPPLLSILISYLTFSFLLFPFFLYFFYSFFSFFLYFFYFFYSFYLIFYLPFFLSSFIYLFSSIFFLPLFRSQSPSSRYFTLLSDNVSSFLSYLSNFLIPLPLTSPMIFTKLSLHTPHTVPTPGLSRFSAPRGLDASDKSHRI